MLHHVSCQIDIWMHAFTFHTFIDCSYESKVGMSRPTCLSPRDRGVPLHLSLCTLWVDAGLATQEGGHRSEPGVGGEGGQAAVGATAGPSHRVGVTLSSVSVPRRTFQGATPVAGRSSRNCWAMRRR